MNYLFFCKKVDIIIWLFLSISKQKKVEQFLILFHTFAHFQIFSDIFYIYSKFYKISNSFTHFNILFSKVMIFKRNSFHKFKES